MYGELSKLPTAKPLKVDNPRFISAGSKLDTEVADAMFGKYEIRLVSCYHTTESGAVAFDLSAKAPKSVGKPIEGIELKITKPNGTALTASKTGVIWLRCPALSPLSIGPYRDVDVPAKAKGKVEVGETDKDGWYRTGDLGKIDRHGKLYLAGREDDIVKIEGKRVALGEVEGCLAAFPKVKEARARLESDPFNGSMVVARVVATGKCHAEELIDHCARNLAPYKVPRRIEFCETI
jgi:long-chain acyl-CoA synthetase